MESADLVLYYKHHYCHLYVDNDNLMYYQSHNNRHNQASKPPLPSLQLTIKSIYIQEEKRKTNVPRILEIWVERMKSKQVQLLTLTMCAGD